MATTPPSLDPVAIAVTIAGLMIGEELAPYAGAYGIIVFGWLGGLLVGLYRREGTGRMSTAAFTAVTLIFTLGITTVVSAQIAKHFSLDATAPLFIVAAAIPAIGDSWVDIVKWGMRLARSVIESRAKGQ